MGYILCIFHYCISYSAAVRWKLCLDKLGIKGLCCVLHRINIRPALSTYWRQARDDNFVFGTKIKDFCLHAARSKGLFYKWQWRKGSSVVLSQKEKDYCANYSQGKGLDHVWRGKERSLYTEGAGQWVWYFSRNKNIVPRVYHSWDWGCPMLALLVCWVSRTFLLT